MELITTRLDEKIQMLINGTESRESISVWAVSIIDNDSIKISNKTAWKIIQNLGSADLMTKDDSYLIVKEPKKINKKVKIKDEFINK